MSITQNIKEVLVKALQDPFTIQSDFAREFALEVAECASRGLINTTHTTTQPQVQPIFGRKWFITMAGLIELNRIISEEVCS